MTTPRRTSEEIEAGIDTIRGRMDETLDDLESRLSPRALLREAAQSLSGIEIGRHVIGLAGLARRHSMPAAIASAGVAGLLLLARYRSRAATVVQPEVTASLWENTSETLGEMRDRVVETGQNLGNMVRDRPVAATAAGLTAGLAVALLIRFGMRRGR